MSTYTTYIAAPPSQICRLLSEQKRDFRQFKKWLSENSTLIPWAVHPLWEDPLSDEESRSYEQDLEITHKVDLLIALYPTSGGSDRRGIEVIERMVLRRPLVVAFHRDSQPSKYLRTMFKHYAQPIEMFERFTDLQSVVSIRLSELAS